MAILRIHHDEDGNTLTVWFDDPRLEHVCEETGDGVVLVKDAAGRVIGFEKLDLVAPGAGPVEVRFETAGAA